MNTYASKRGLIGGVGVATEGMGEGDAEGHWRRGHGH
jgi:hypothetical protein